MFLCGQVVFQLHVDVTQHDLGLGVSRKLVSQAAKHAFRLERPVHGDKQFGLVFSRPCIARFVLQVGFDEPEGAFVLFRLVGDQ